MNNAEYSNPNDRGNVGSYGLSDFSEEPFVVSSDAIVVQGPVRDNVEDRAYISKLQTNGGLSLVLSIVADGVGGNAFGEVAAQDTLDQVVAFVQNSDIRSPDQIPLLLQEAILQANQYVYVKSRQNKKMRGMASTVVVCAVYGKKLYVANIGDSRVYLYDSESERLLQLTLDHSWANDVVRAGHYKMEEALKHPKAHELHRSIGTRAEVEVDSGFYPDQNPASAGFEMQANSKPWLLKTGDRVVLCSDGLIKGQPQNEEVPYVSDREITQAVLTKEPQQAAQELINTALKRSVDDNVSVIVMETPGSERVKARGVGGFRPRWLITGVIVLALLSGAGWLFMNQGGVLTENAQPTAEEVNSPSIVNSGTDTQEVVATEDPAENVNATSGTSQPEETGLESSSAQGVEISPKAYLADQTLPLNENKDVIIKLEDLTNPDGSFVVDIKDSFQGEGVYVQDTQGALAGFDKSDGQGIFGVTFDTNSERYIFEVHCLSGSCILSRDGQTKKKIQAGEAAALNNAVDFEPILIKYENFVDFNPNVPTLTPTPESSPTPMPTQTRLPASSATTVPLVDPAESSEPNPEESPVTAPDPNDRDGDGVLHNPENGQYDLCQDAPGTQANCGCPPEQVTSACVGAENPKEAPPEPAPPGG